MDWHGLILSEREKDEDAFNKYVLLLLPDKTE
jgi:hypothetical protein